MLLGWNVVKKFMSDGEFSMLRIFLVVVCVVLIFLWIIVVWVVEFIEISFLVFGLNYVGESWGVFWGDFNGDGYLDIYLSNYWVCFSIWCNNGDGIFIDIVI